MPIPVRIDQDFGGVARVTNLLDPASAQDAATKTYVDNLVEGLAWKDSVRAASTVNITLTAPGATIDAVTMVASDRFLAKNQTLGQENGTYVWNGAASAATRTLDMNVAAEVERAVVGVEEGTANANTTWVQTTPNVTLGTTALTWSAFGTSSPAASETTAGIAELATQAETDAGTDDLRIVTPLKQATWSGRKLKFSATFGDGSATSYTHTHNLGTKDVSVYIYEVGGSFRQVLAEVQHTTTNSVTSLYSAAPATNSLRVVILG